MKKSSINRLIILYGILNVFCNLAHPITPTMFIEKNFPDYMFGVSYAAMSLTLFLASPLWGNIGDRIGHGKVMAITSPLYGITQLGFGFSDSVLVTILIRLAGGFFTAGFIVCSMAYIVNLANEQNRGKSMAYYVASGSVGTAFGYFLGGVIGAKSLYFVFIFQFVTLLITGILIYILIEDSIRVKKKFSFNNPLESLTEFKKGMSPIFISFMWAVFLTSFATTAFDNAFNYYLKDALSLSSSYNGIIKAIIGIVTLIVNFTLNIYIVNKTQPRKSLIIVLMLCGITSLSVIFIKDLYPYFIGSIIFYMFNAIYLPIQQDIATQDQDVESSGVISGIFNSARSAGMVFGALFAGFIYSLGNTLPFIFASLTFFLSVVMSIINYNQFKKSKSEVI